MVATDAALFRSRTRPAPPRTTIERLCKEHRRLLPYPGSSRVEAVLELVADGAQTPLESVSRLVMLEAGFSAPQLQVPLRLPELGTTAHLDFGWRELGIAAEADGRGKYRSGGGDGVEAVIAEKDRENAIRRQVVAFDRWDWADAIAKTPLVRRLDRLGVPRVGVPRRLVGDAREPAARPSSASRRRR
ncbi:hypothetical protein ACFPER_07360 [Agromyces aurantiacus]|uniref:DUF559 domain-containing protein n=1 Tax=Agromyces aurantiacus TaxID=165814 RepID=A0ABV9R539_9MICO|nr:hypothetical protein [Agromyces aurantiacus]MBM7503284.1 hypothetical protein [Agromyces aurantiacus]